MFGADILVAPILTEGADGRDVYLPAGTWIDAWTGQSVEGGLTIMRRAPIAEIPVFVRAGAAVLGAFADDLGG